MNGNRTLKLISIALGLISLMMTLLAGIHLQHLINNGGGRHLGEAVVLIVLALGLFAGSVWVCQRERKARREG
jgi:heme/copper-type cytochrome/quinol oxidase subunit 4